MKEINFGETGKILKEFIPEDEKENDVFSKIFARLTEQFELKTDNDFNLAEHYLLKQLELRSTIAKLKVQMKRDSSKTG